jgi:DNA-binding GntR family transcriptional regulator
VSTEADISIAGADRFTPIYVRIQDRIRSAIATGALGPGDRLPTETELSSEFRTTRSTVRHALDRLVYEGLIHRRVGRGSFVAETGVLRSPIDSRRCLTFEEQVALSGHVVTYRAPSLELVPAPRQVAQCLGIEPQSHVFKMERLRVIDQRPVGLEIRYLPQEIGRHVTGDMLTRSSAHSFISHIIGERMPTIVVSITAELAGARVAQLLEIAEGSAVIVRSNTHHATSGAAKTCGRSIYRGDVTTEYVLGQELPDPSKA